MMTPTEVQDRLDALHAEFGIKNIKDVPLTIPGKGHWLWGLYTRMYPK